MNKIDLIIDALEYASQFGYDITTRESIHGIDEALAAARELKALEPVAWQVMDKNDALREFSIKDIAQDWITTELLRGSSIVYWIRPLYALEVTK
jgi:hypothetical protein